MNAISEDVICVHVMVAKIQTAGILVGEERIAEIAELRGPEDLDERYLGQKSVEILAQELQSIIAKTDQMNLKLNQFGGSLNARNILTRRAAYELRRRRVDAQGYMAEDSLRTARY